MGKGGDMQMTYILIMTMWLNGTYASMTTAEFSNEQACRYAGAQQEMTLRNDLKVNTKNYTFICVPKEMK